MRPSSFFGRGLSNWRSTFDIDKQGGILIRGGSALRAVLTWALVGLSCLAPVSTEAQETPVRGGTLVVAISADPGHLNPAITTGGATHTAAELLYNGLVGRDERGDPIPELAESWSVEQGGASTASTCATA